MCTLTYLLNEDGYELFFNRDEQRCRLLAEPPKFNKINKSNGAIYPIDPQGGGTWIAVNEQGLSLALLNNYQAPLSNDHNKSISRGQLILSLLQIQGNVINELQSMDLSVYQPFQLCIFPEDLSKYKQSIYCFKWNGSQLIEVSVNVEADLPITSSSIDFVEVRQKRKHRFACLVDAHKPLSNQLKDFHFSTEVNGKHSVNMQREDAKTVSFSHISVNSHLSIKNEIRFEYFDNIVKETHTTIYPLPCKVPGFKPIEAALD